MRISNILFNPNSTISSTDLNTLKNIFDYKTNLISNFIFSEGELVYGTHPVVYNNLFFIPIINIRYEILNNIAPNSTILVEKSELYGRYISYHFDEYTNMTFLILQPINNSFVLNGDKLLYNKEIFAEVDLFNNYFIGSILHFSWSVYYLKGKFVELKNYFKVINPYYNEVYSNVYLVLNEVEDDKSYDFNENEFGIFYDDYYTGNSYFYDDVDVVLTFNSTTINNGVKIGEILNNQFVSSVNDYNSEFIKKVWSVLGNRVLSNYSIFVDSLNKKIKISNLNYLYNGNLYLNKLKYIDLSEQYETYNKNNLYYNLPTNNKFIGNLEKIGIFPKNSFVWLCDEKNLKVGCAKILDVDENNIYLYNIIFFTKVKFSKKIDGLFSFLNRINDGMFFIEDLDNNEVLVYSNREIFLFENIKGASYEVLDYVRYNQNYVKTIKTINEEILFNVSDFEFNYIFGYIDILEKLEELVKIHSIRYPEIKDYNLNSSSSGIINIPENFDDLNSVNGLIFNNLGNYKVVEIKENINQNVLIEDSFIKPNENYLLKIVREKDKTEIRSKSISIFKIFKNNFEEYILPIEDKSYIIKISPDLDKIYVTGKYFGVNDIDNYITDEKNNKIFKIIDVIASNILVVLKIEKSDININDLFYYNEDKIKINKYEFYEGINLSNLSLIKINEYENNSFILFKSDLDISNYYALVYYSDELFSTIDNKLCIRYKDNNIAVSGSGVYRDPYYISPDDEILSIYFNQNLKENFLYQNNYIEIDLTYRTIENKYINLSEEVYLDDNESNFSLGVLQDYIEVTKENKRKEEEIKIVKLYNTEGIPKRENLILSDYKLVEINSSTENEEVFGLYYINLNFEKVNITMTNYISRTDNEFYYRIYGKNIDNNIVGIKIPRIAYIGNRTYTPFIGEIVKDNLGNLYKVDSPSCTFYEYNPYTDNEIVNDYTSETEYLVLRPIKIKNIDFDKIIKLFNLNDVSKNINVLEFSLLKDKYNNVEYFLVPKKDVNLDELYNFNKFIYFEIKSNTQKTLFGFNFYCQFLDGGVVYFEINNQKIMANKNNYNDGKLNIILNSPINLKKGDIIYVNIYPNDSVNFVWCDKIYFNNYFVGEVNRNLFTNNKKFIKFDIIEIEFLNSIVNKTFDINFPEIKSINRAILELLPQKILIYLDDFDVSEIPTNIYIGNIRNPKKIKYIGTDISIDNSSAKDLIVDYIPESIMPYNSMLSTSNPGFLYYKGNIISFTGVDYTNYKILNCKLVDPGEVTIKPGDYLEYYMFGNIPGFVIDNKQFLCTKVMKNIKYTVLELSVPEINFNNEKILCYNLNISNKMMFNYYFNDNPKTNIKLKDGNKEEIIRSKEGVLNNYYSENVKVNLFNHHGVYDCYENSIKLKTSKPYKIKNYKNFFKKYISKYIDKSHIDIKFKKLNNYTKIYLYDVYTKKEIKEHRVISDSNYKIVRFNMPEYLNKLFEGYLIVETNSYYSEVEYE